MCIYPRAKGLGAIFVAIFVPPAAGTGTDVATDTGSLPRAPQEPPRGRPGRQREAKNEKPTKISLFVFFSFYFFFFASRRQPRSTSGTAAVAAGEKGTEPGTDPLPKLPRPPGCRGEPSPLRPPPGTAEAPGARSPTRSRQPPSSRCPPGLRRGFLAFLGSRSRAERETGLGKGEPYKKAATPHVPIPRDPKGKGEGICPAPFPGSLARMGQQLRGKRL